MYLTEIIDDLSDEVRRLLKTLPTTPFLELLRAAYTETVKNLELPADKRQALDVEFERVCEVLADVPLAKTAPFFDVPEKKKEGSGGLLSICINPNACKGCNLCVEVCPEGALRTVEQDEKTVESLRRGWEFWQRLPDTPDRFLQIHDLHKGIGVLHTLFLKKKNYRAMVGGDGACMGCGEKTGVHLVVSTITAAMQPHVAKFVQRIDDLIEKLDTKSRLTLAADVDLDKVARYDHAEISLEGKGRQRLSRLMELRKKLVDLSWRYKSGPSGQGRAALGMTNATGCSSVWGSTYPYNPYPFPWVNHLFQDAPSIAIGIFEGHMRKMADAFAAVRKAELELKDTYDPAIHDEFFSLFDWRNFTDEEFLLCPPIVAMGGDGAMYDIGFQNLSRLMASGMPLRVVVLDTQVYSNTGGQACTSGLFGQVSDMAAYGRSQHGKIEERKELALIAMAHRTSFVLQSSQAAPVHLMGGVLRGLASRRPAIFNIYAPCQTEHGIADNASETAARLAVESRAYPFMLYDPDAGSTLAERLDLEGNPVIEEDWPTYELTYQGDEGNEQQMVLPMTIADWAATEKRFAKHFVPAEKADTEVELIPYHEYLEMTQQEQQDKRPFIYTLESDKRLKRLLVSDEIVQLGRERLGLWSQLREMSGDVVGDAVREKVLEDHELEFEQRLVAMREQYEHQIEEMKRNYPLEVARRMAEALLPESRSVEELAATLAAEPVLPLPAPAPGSNGPRVSSETARLPVIVPGPNGPQSGVKTEPPDATKAETKQEVQEEEELGMGPWIDEEFCTACGDCMKINPKLFVFNENRKATIADPSLGTFSDLVRAAELCPSRAIHPGEPLNKKEKNLEKWLERAAPFNESFPRDEVKSEKAIA
jgi:pyruvate-ferredoxin/flavodoxin oxidoreductase